MFGNLVSERDSFRFDNEDHIESRYANKTFWISEIIAIWGAVESHNAGKQAQRLAEEGGALSQAASYANAADVEALGALNAGAITAAAKNNASMYREIGYANAQAITDATLHNLQMSAIENDEEQRLHRREERWHAGNIRAMAGSTGVMVNSGSPMAYLNSEITKGLQERDFLATRAQYAMMGDASDGLRKSLLTVKSANMNARVTEQNAALQANVAISESIARAAAMRRQGDISAAVGVANGQAAYYGGQASAIGAIGNAAGSLQNTYLNYRNNSGTGSSWNSQFSSGNGSFGGSNWKAGYAGPR
jgi:hypothetical protein